MTEENKEKLRVVIGVIWNDRFDEILVSRRLESKEFGGLWEFPGGKVEVLEGDAEALDRELNEELGIWVNEFIHRFDFTHPYDDKTIEFIAYDIYSYEGDIEGREGQEIKWVPIDLLDPKDFPPADFYFIDHIIKYRAHANSSS